MAKWIVLRALMLHGEVFLRHAGLFEPLALLSMVCWALFISGMVCYIAILALAAVLQETAARHVEARQAKFHGKSVSLRRRWMALALARKKQVLRIQAALARCRERRPDQAHKSDAKVPCGVSGEQVR